MNTLLLIAVVLAASLSEQVQADGFPGNELKGYCRYVDSAEEATKQIALASCVMYVVGVMDGMLLQNVIDSLTYGTSKDTHCVPDNTTRGQMAALIKKYLAENPRELHKPAAILVANALTKAYPCEEGQ